jgi:hypothetical protein
MNGNFRPHERQDYFHNGRLRDPVRIVAVPGERRRNKPFAPPDRLC